MVREKQYLRDGTLRPGGGKTKGYGFVSFLDPFDGLKGMNREERGPASPLTSLFCGPMPYELHYCYERNLKGLILWYCLPFVDPPPLTAMREMNGKYIGSRPVKIRKSDWQERGVNEVRKKEKNKKKFLASLGLA